MKRFLILVGLVSLLAACTPQEQNNLTLSPGAVVLPEAEVDSADATSMNVQTDKDLKAGQIIVSDEGDGLVRQITGVTVTGTSQVGTQIVRKVYLQTQDASLEDAVASGNANLDWGALQFDAASMSEALPGVSVQALTGRINLTNVKFNISGMDVTVNGYVEQTLNPTFNMKFASNKVSSFEAGIAGSLKASIQASIKTSQKIPFNKAVEQQLAKFSLKRAFLAGTVPVIVVIEPRLVAGASGGSDKAITVNAGIAPTLKVNLGVKYDSATGKWSKLGTDPAFSASLNPTFSYTVPGGGQGEVYAKLVLDVKFYGLVGPSLEAKPYVNLALNAVNPTATLKGGLTGTGKVQAGFKVLGKGLETEYTFPNEIKAEQSYSCSQATSSCN